MEGLFTSRRAYIRRTLVVRGPWWLGHVARREIDVLLELGFDPNVLQEDEAWLPLQNRIQSTDVRGVDVLLEMGARVTPESLELGKQMCCHTEKERLDYQRDCCLILEMIQHAHDLPPRLCATEVFVAAPRLRNVSGGVSRK
jgi:hypothetical protein